MLSENELLATFFATDDLKSVYDMDDPVEILAAVDLDNPPLPDKDQGFEGFEDDDREFEDLVRHAKVAKARLDRKRRAGSLDYLAKRLAKTSRQVREYCKRGLVPGAYQTAGGQWRVHYNEGTVEQVRAALGSTSRIRSEGWLIKRLRKWEAEDVLPPLFKPLRSKALAHYENQCNWIQRLCANAAMHLRRKKRKVTCTAVSKLTKLSRTTIRKHMPDLAGGGKGALLYNNPWADIHIDGINAKKKGRVKTQNFDFDD